MIAMSPAEVAVGVVHYQIEIHLSQVFHYFKQHACIYIPINLCVLTTQNNLSIIWSFSENVAHNIQ